MSGSSMCASTHSIAASGPAFFTARAARVQAASLKPMELSVATRAGSATRAGAAGCCWASAERKSEWRPESNKHVLASTIGAEPRH